jgi:hypothetical protein
MDVSAPVIDVRGLRKSYGDRRWFAGPVWRRGPERSVGAGPMPDSP